MELTSGSCRPTREESPPELLSQVLLTDPDSSVGGATFWKGGILGEDPSAPPQEVLSCPIESITRTPPSHNRCRAQPNGAPLSAMPVPGSLKNAVHTQWVQRLCSPREGGIACRGPARCSDTKTFMRGPKMPGQAPARVENKCRHRTDRRLCPNNK